MTRHRIVIGAIAVLALALAANGNVLLLGYTVAIASLAIVVGLMGWSILNAIKDSDVVLKKPWPFQRAGRAITPEERRRAA